MLRTFILAKYAARRVEFPLSDTVLALATALWRLGRVQFLLSHKHASTVVTPASVMTMHLHMSLLAVWLSRNALVSINVVTLRQAWLLVSACMGNLLGAEPGTHVYSACAIHPWVSP